MIRRFLLLLILLAFLSLAALPGEHTGESASSSVHAAGGYGAVMKLNWVNNEEHFFPAVAHNPDAGEFLVVWHSDAPGGPRRIFASRITHDGTIRGEFVLAGTHDRAQPAAAYDPVNQRYLVTWSEDINGNGSNWDIYGSFVSPNPQTAYVLIGDPFMINNFATNQWESTLVYNSLEKTFLLFWTNEYQSQPLPTYLSGQMINIDGSFTVPTEATISGTDNYLHASVAYNDTANEFLLVYERNDGDPGIYGQRLDKDGGPVGGSIGIADRVSPEEKPAAAYCPVSDSYFVTWQDYPQGKSDYDVYGRYISPAGVVGTSGPIAAQNGLDELDPVVACAPSGNSFYLLWLQESAAAGPEGTWGRELTANFSGQPAAEIAAHEPAVPDGNARPVIVAGGIGYLAVWQHQLTGTTNDIRARFLYQEALFLPFIIK